MTNFLLKRYILLYNFLLDGFLKASGACHKYYPDNHPYGLPGFFPARLRMDRHPLFSLTTIFYLTKQGI